MSLKALPLIAIPLILYNALVVFAGSSSPTEFLQKSMFSFNMISGAEWSFSRGDLVILVTLLVLFAELVKSTYTATSSLVDHGLSMLVFVACIIEFLVARSAASSTFFFVMLAALIDVVAGFTIGIRVARRDLSIGADA